MWASFQFRSTCVVFRVMLREPACNVKQHLLVIFAFRVTHHHQEHPQYQVHQHQLDQHQLDQHQLDQHKQ